MVCAFSVEAAQVVIMALENVSFKRLLRRLVMTLLKNDGFAWFYHRCSRELKKGGGPESISLGLVCILLVSPLTRW